eukprot:gene18232-4721_t
MNATAVDASNCNTIGNGTGMPSSVATYFSGSRFVVASPAPYTSAAPELLS